MGGRDTAAELAKSGAEPPSHDGSKADQSRYVGKHGVVSCPLTCHQGIAMTTPVRPNSSPPQSSSRVLDYPCRAPIAGADCLRQIPSPRRNWPAWSPAAPKWPRSCDRTPTRRSTRVYPYTASADKIPRVMSNDRRGCWTGGSALSGGSRYRPTAYRPTPRAGAR